MKTLAKYHACNHCVIGEKTFRNIVNGTFEKRALERPGNFPGPIRVFSDKCFSIEVNFC